MCVIYSRMHASPKNMFDVFFCVCAGIQVRWLVTCCSTQQVQKMDHAGSWSECSQVALPLSHKKSLGHKQSLPHLPSCSLTRTSMPRGHNCLVTRWLPPNERYHILQASVNAMSPVSLGSLGSWLRSCGRTIERWWFPLMRVPNHGWFKRENPKIPPKWMI